MLILFVRHDPKSCLDLLISTVAWHSLAQRFHTIPSHPTLALLYKIRLRRHFSICKKCFELPNKFLWNENILCSCVNPDISLFISTTKIGLACFYKLLKDEDNTFGSWREVRLQFVGWISWVILNTQEQLSHLHGCCQTCLLFTICFVINNWTTTLHRPCAWNGMACWRNHHCLIFFTAHIPCICLHVRQSCEMSNLLHGANLPNQILPQENSVNCNKFNT